MREESGPSLIDLPSQWLLISGISLPFPYRLTFQVTADIVLTPPCSPIPFPHETCHLAEDLSALTIRGVLSM